LCDLASATYAHVAGWFTRCAARRTGGIKVFPEVEPDNVGTRATL
jgi:hypothetical protein